MKDIEFWFSIGSPYTYLTVMRLPGLQQKTGIQVDWRPFPLRRIMIEMNNFPFLEKPAKEAYLWQDIARQARKYGLRPNLPAPFPLEGCELADRVALVAREEGWIEPYVRSSYRHWLEGGHPAGAEPNLSRSISESGHKPDRVIARAESAALEGLFGRALREAREKGIFGAPSFIVGEQLFWGDDRLHDAIREAIPQPTAQVLKKPANGSTPQLPPQAQGQAGNPSVRHRSEA